jgi:hypothetical protein
MAVVVTTNLDATGTSGQIASRIADILFRTTDAATQQAVAQVRRIFEGLQHDTIDRTLFTANANAYFSDQAMTDFASSLGPLGAPTAVTQTSQSLRGGMTFRAFRIECGRRTVSLSTFIMPDGKFEQYQIASP